MKKYFKNLRKSDNFWRLLQTIPFNELMEYEKIVENYENSSSKDNYYKDNPIIKWWEDFWTTADFINYYIDTFGDSQKNNYKIIYPLLNENLDFLNTYELRINYPMDFRNELYYAKDGFCKEFETIDKAFEYIEINHLY